MTLSVPHRSCSPAVCLLSSPEGTYLSTSREKSETTFHPMVENPIHLYTCTCTCTLKGGLPDSCMHGIRMHEMLQYIYMYMYMYIVHHTYTCTCTLYVHHTYTCTCTLYIIHIHVHVHVHCTSYIYMYMYIVHHTYTCTCVC